MRGIPIIFEDEDVVVINKPSGISVHKSKKTDEYTIADFAKEIGIKDDVGEPFVLENGEIVKRVGIVHRLDKDTSGALVIAKNKESFKFIKSQFQNREIKKTYLAFVYGTPKDQRGVIDKPIGRATSDIRKWTTGKSARGEFREAITRYRVLASKEGIAFVVCWPKTGRTHQIRVHLLSIGHPIVSDNLYAKGKSKILGFKRQALHAYRIEFRTKLGSEIIVSAPFPDDFKDAFKQFGLDHTNLPI